MKKSFVILFFYCLSFPVLFAQEEFQKQSQKVDSLLKDHYQEGNPGIAVAVIKDGHIIYKNEVGMANLEHEISITDSTAFHIASVSKQFTAYLALLLEKEGKLSMSDDVRKHLSELKELPYKLDLYQLANHTHGLPNLFELAHLKGIDPQDRMTHKVVVEMLLNIKTVNFKPGEKYEYNNTGFALLAEIIERVEGKSFQEILKERIFEPAGMSNSIAVGSPDLIVKNKANSYKLANGKYNNYHINLMANGSSGISTTIKDLSKWTAKFQAPSYQAREIFEQMRKPTVLNSGETVQYGLGLQFKKYKGIDLVFHGGGDAGYRSYILHAPEHQLSIVVLGNNNDFTPLRVVYEIVDLFLQEQLSKPAAPGKTHYTTKELKPFEGTYQMFPGTYYNIIAENDTLYFQSYGSKDKAPLPVIGDNEFLFPYIPTAKFTFYENGFYFHIADFKYNCQQVQIEKVNTEELELSEYTGLFRNKAFNAVYELVIKNGELVAKHSLNEDITLYPLSKDSFYSKRSFFGKLDFVRNEKRNIINFNVSGQNLKNIKFIKIDPCVSN